MADAVGFAGIAPCFALVPERIVLICISPVLFAPAYFSILHFPSSAPHRSSLPAFGSYDVLFVPLSLPLTPPAFSSSSLLSLRFLLSPRSPPPPCFPLPLSPPPLLSLLLDVTVSRGAFCCLSSTRGHIIAPSIVCCCFCSLLRAPLLFHFR